MKSDANVPRILKMDGVGLSVLDQANQEVTPMFGLIEKYGQEKSWSHTVIDSPSNSATLICQLPGEGNREHFHPDWDEWWYIVKGKWEWVIEGKSTIIKEGDIVFIERNRLHHITAVGDSASLRLAVSRYDVGHVYKDGSYQE